MIKYLNIIYEVIIEVWLVIVTFILVYGFGEAIYKIIIWGQK